MKPIQFLLTMGACLTIALPTIAKPEANDLERMERELREGAEEVENRARHLKEAANHLKEAGLEEQAKKVHEQAKKLVSEFKAQYARLEAVKKQAAARRVAESRQKEAA